MGFGLSRDSRRNYRGVEERRRMLIAFALGFVFGFAGAMPVAGPISALVVKRIIDGRLRAARSLGAGASIADGGYAYLAFWGVTGLLQSYPIIDLVSRGVAAVILLVLGVHFIRREPRDATTDRGPAVKEGVKRSFVLGLTINASNPTLLATWTAAVVFVNGSGLIELSQHHAPLFGLGACLGMAVWFILLVGLVERFSVRLRPGSATMAIRGTGAVLLVVGLLFAYDFVTDLT